MIRFISYFYIKFNEDEFSVLSLNGSQSTSISAGIIHSIPLVLFIPFVQRREPRKTKSICLEFVTIFNYAANRYRRVRISWRKDMTNIKIWKAQMAKIGIKIKTVAQEQRHTFIKRRHLRFAILKMIFVFRVCYNLNAICGLCNLYINLLVCKFNEKSSKFRFFMHFIGSVIIGSSFKHSSSAL